MEFSATVLALFLGLGLRILVESFYVNVGPRHSVSRFGFLFRLTFKPRSSEALNFKFRVAVQRTVFMCVSRVATREFSLQVPNRKFNSPTEIFIAVPLICG